MNQSTDPLLQQPETVAQILALLQQHPDRALARVVALKEGVIGSPRLWWLEGLCHRALGQLETAKQVFTILTQQWSDFPLGWFELGRLCFAEKSYVLAGKNLQQAVHISFSQPEAHRLLAVCALYQQNTELANRAFKDYRSVAQADVELRAIQQASQARQLSEMERLLKIRLKRSYDDPIALGLLAELAIRAERYPQAVELLEHAVKLQTDDMATRHQLAYSLMQAQRFDEALEHIEICLKSDVTHLGYRFLQAGVLASLGEYQKAKQIFNDSLREDPTHANGWLGLGHVLRTLGEFNECVAAYREAIRCQSTCGEAYFSLANLKTFQFAESELSAMLALAERVDLPPAERVNVEFALGKLFEDRRDFGRAFEYYQSANATRKQQVPYAADAHTAYIDRLIEYYALDGHKDTGRAIATPKQTPALNSSGGVIFIVGLPRAGSTLLEQILASHSAIEGTMELPILPKMVRDLLGNKEVEEGPRYPQLLSELSDADFEQLGQQYLTMAKRYRHTDRAWFIDKMPNNFTHIGLIKRMLPDAKVIDIRRHPLASCFSNFKQHFARGQNFTYNFNDLGSYYRDYHRLMTHFDQRFPGFIQRIIYEDLVQNPEAEIGRLLAAMGFDYEPACLAFHQNARAVRTASAQQVREPLNRKGLDQWQHFEPWLAPLRESLGDLLSADSTGSHTGTMAAVGRWRN